MFQVLNSQMWLVAILLNSKYIEDDCKNVRDDKNKSLSHVHSEECKKENINLLTWEENLTFKFLNFFLTSILPFMKLITQHFRSHFSIRYLIRSHFSISYLKTKYVINYEEIISSANNELKYL